MITQSGKTQLLEAFQGRINLDLAASMQKEFGQRRRGKRLSELHAGMKERDFTPFVKDRCKVW